MIRTSLFLALALFSCAKPALDAPSTAANHPSVTKAVELAENEFPCVKMYGQSNMVGIATPRLTNPYYTQYPANPTDVHIFWKPGDKTYANQILDNGEWQPLVIGENNGCNGSPAAPDLMGMEVPLGVALRDYFGKPVYIIKCAFSSTGVTSTISPPGVPGNWNNTNREIAIEHYVRKAHTQFTKNNPGMVLRDVGTVWWGGETDAQKHISKPVFISQFNSMRSYLDTSSASIFGHAPGPWVVMKLNFWRNSWENIIDAAFTDIAAADPTMLLIDSEQWPRNNALTPAQAIPVPRSTVVPNVAGVIDDGHSSHVAHKAIGPIAANHFINAAQ